MLSVALATATYRFLEQPIRRGQYALDTARTVLSLAATAIAALAGAWCFVADGFPDRHAGNPADRHDPRGHVGLARGHLFPSLGPGRGVLRKLPAGNPARPAHAAALGRLRRGAAGAGLRTLLRTLRVIQRTASGYRPIVDVRFINQPLYHDINTAILRSVEDMQPARVVLAGRWAAIDWPQLQRTIHALHSRGIAQIDLIGPAPEWESPLPRLLFHRFEKSPGHSLASRSNEGLAPEIATLDASMAVFAQAQGVRYESVRSTLCDAHGCLALMGGQPTAWDAFHLTPVAADSVVSRFDGAAGPALSK